MINKVKQKIKNNKTLVTNFSYLGGLQIFNLLLPLLTYPYLIRVLGKELWGEVVFVQTVILYFSTIVGFGFDVSATKEISINRSNKKEMEKIISSVFIIKSGLLLFCFFILCLAIFIIPSLQDNKLLYFYSFIICIGNFLFPIWFFQGIEQMKYITIVNLFTKLLFFIFVFVFIKTDEDYIYVPLLNGIGLVLGGSIGLWILFKKYNLEYVQVKMREIMKYTKEAFHFFITDFSVFLKARTNVIVIGAFIGKGEVAYYDLAVKIVGIAEVPFTIINRVLFPNFSRGLNKKKLKQSLLIVFSLSLLVYIFLILFSKIMIVMLGGDSLLPAKQIIYILGIGLPFAAISSMLGIALASKGYSKSYMLADVYALFIYILSIGVLALFKIVTVYTLPISVMLGLLFTIYYKYKITHKIQLI